MNEIIARSPFEVEERDNRFYPPSAGVLHHSPYIFVPLDSWARDIIIQKNRSARVYGVQLFFKSYVSEKEVYRKIERILVPTMVGMYEQSRDSTFVFCHTTNDSSKKYENKAVTKAINYNFVTIPAKMVLYVRNGNRTLDRLLSVSKDDY